MMHEVVLNRKFGAIILILAGLASAQGDVTGMHPYFTRQSILPSAMNAINGIGGIGLLPNGDGVICTWGGSQASNGEVWIVPNLASGGPGTPTRIATGLREALGVAVVGNDFYVMEKPRINRFVGSGTAWSRSTLWSLPTAWYNDGQWHHFSFNLVFKDNYFWFTTGMAYPHDNNDPLQRGALIRVPLAGGSFAQFARGLRNTNGMGLGPNNEIFIADNQGDWKPADYVYHIPLTNIPTNGRFYGYRTNANNSCGMTAPNQPATLPPATAACSNDREYPPAIWMPYADGSPNTSNFSNSPTRPILIPSGPYAGQMLIGDVRHGGIDRLFVEMVGGEYQGAAFRFAAPNSLSSGINQMIWLPGGQLLAAGIGAGSGSCTLGGSGNWNWNSTCRGLDLLTPTGTTPFEMLAIRSITGGFEIQFTQTPNAAAGTAGNYTIRARGLTPVQAYGSDGNPGDNDIAVTINTATLNGNRVTLQVSPLTPAKFYYILLGTGITSSTGGTLRSREAWYTLNTLGTATPVLSPKSDFAKKLKTTVWAGKLSVSLPFNRPYHLGLYRLDGSKLAEISGSSPGTLEKERVEPGIYLLSGNVDGAPVREKVRVQ